MGYLDILRDGLNVDIGLIEFMVTKGQFVKSAGNINLKIKRVKMVGLFKFGKFNEIELGEKTNWDELKKIASEKKII